MGTTYQVPNLASYENHNLTHHSAYVSTLSQAARSRASLSDSVYALSSSRPTVQSQTSSQPVLNHQEPQIPQYQSSVHPHNTTHHQSVAASSVLSQGSASRPSTRPSTPSSSTSKTMSTTGEHGKLSERDSGMVMHSLVIPKCISKNGGSLADFAAEITALFWFEPIKTLQAAENTSSLAPTALTSRLDPAAVASPYFKKWVKGVLSTTQVTQNVVLLALLFIYRLKSTNPRVNGRQGSEYRLLTVALMLGNKFLDDNTYTNKTWADVSGIPVTEIHVMEVEFLSNMRYSLLASKNQWEEWLVKLTKFWDYIDRSTRPPASPSPLQIPSPSHRNFASPLPSPTGNVSFSHLTPNLHTAPHSAHTNNVFSPLAATSMYNNGNNGQAWVPPYVAGSIVSPLSLKPDVGASRKRGLAEEDPTEVAAKRPHVMHQSYPIPHPQHQPLQPSQPSRPQSQAFSQMAVSQQVQVVQQQQQQHPALAQHPAQHLVAQQTQVQQHPMAMALHARPVPSAPKPVPSQTRLSLPNLTINTSAPSTIAAGVSQMPVAPMYPAASYAPQQGSALSLPPLVPGVRAMATVYPTVATTYAQQLPILATTAGPGVASSANLAAVTPTTSFPPMTYGTPTKRLSPQNAITPAFAASSPISEPPYPHAVHHTPLGGGHSGTPSGVHTPMSHSPSLYLQQRPSPYKPVRYVNTLLHPPPSAFLDQYHFSSVPHTQMHYQPLGRRHELRTGIVPEFMLAAQYGGGGQQHHGLTPSVVPSVQPSHPHMLRNDLDQGQQGRIPQPQFAPASGRHLQSHYPAH
jgi:hypothetical protein